MPSNDLVVYDPTGPMAAYSRMYRSILAAQGYKSPGLTPGWTDIFDLTITASGANYILHYPNGASETWTPGTGGVYNPPSGAPYLANLTGGNFVLTYKDHSTQTFTPDPNTAGRFLYTRTANIAGSGIAINRRTRV